MSSERRTGAPAVTATGLGKCFHVYARPQDRLKEALFRWAKHYYREFWALRDVTFEIAPGEAVGVIGRNGAGKSTLLQMITGTLAPTTGHIRVNGRVAALLELGSGFNPEFTGRENVFLNGAILGLSRADVSSRFDEIAAFAGIGDFIDQPVKTYSSGMAVRLAFAVQVLLEPDVLIVDEALAVGDASFQRKCFARLEELRTRGVSLLFVSHSLEMVRSLCSRALYLERGRAKAWGPANQVCDLFLADLLAEQMSTTGAGKATPSRANQTSQASAACAKSVVLASYTRAGAAGKNEQGTGAVELHSLEISPVEPTDLAAVEGRWIRVRAELLATESVPEFVIGVLLRNRFGEDMFGVSRRSSDLEIAGGMSAGDRFAVTFDVRCDLRPDTYFITLGVQAPGFSDVLYYGHDLAHFTLERSADRDPLMIGGIARLEHRLAATVIVDRQREEVSA